MNGEAEHTPTDPGTDVEQHAIDTAATDAAAIVRSLRGASRRLQHARPEERPAVVADTREFIAAVTKILDRQGAILEQLQRRDAATMELEAVTGRRPHGWFAYVNGAIAAVSGIGGFAAWSQDHPNVALGLTAILALSAYLANTPVPFMRRERNDKGKTEPMP